MRNYLIFLLSLCFSVHSQQNAYHGEIEYIESYNPGSKENHLLRFNSTQSFYEQVVGPLKEEREIKSNDDGSFNISYNYNQKVPEFVYTDWNSSEILFRQKIGMEIFTVNEELTRISWDLTSESKKIGKFLCQKAIGEFRGRTYAAWFTPEIPVPFGPWKLNGLGGLILEVTESTGLYRVIAKKINISPNESSNGLKPEISDSELISKDEFVEASKSIHEETIRFINSKLPKGSSLPVSKSKGYSMEIFN